MSLQVNSNGGLSNLQHSWDTYYDSKSHHISHVDFGVFIRGRDVFIAGFLGVLVSGKGSKPSL